MRCRLLLLAGVPLLIAAAPSWNSRALAGAAPFIDKANNEWTKAIVSGDAAVLSAPYDDNGIFVGPDGSEVRGRDAIRAMYGKRRADVQVLKASIKSDGRVAADPDDVYEWGSATMTIRREGTTHSASGRYLTVWHHTGNRWVITHNIAF